MAQRIKGQEITVSFTSPGGVEDQAFAAVQTLEVELQLEILTEGYLGETSDRRDDIFKGARGRAELHMEGSAALRFVQRVKDRAQRRAAASGQFNLLATLNFPNGETPRVLLEDLFWGGVPLNIGGRNEFVKLTLEFECSEGRFLF